MSELEVLFQDREPFFESGSDPKDHHPPGYGMITKHVEHEQGGVKVSVHSTERREDGWSYNVVLAHELGEWIGYFHHQPTNKRVYHAGHAPQLAEAFRLD